MTYRIPPPVQAILSNDLKTREDAIRLLRDLVKPVHEGMSSGHGRVRLGFTGSGFDYGAAEMEGFCRPLWGLAPLMAVEPDHPDFQEFIASWVDGLDNATNPDHEDYWGQPGPTDQRYVEMAAIAFAILIAPKTFWVPLSKEAQLRVADYLGFINAKSVVLPANNWTFFRILVNVALRSVNQVHSGEQIEKDFDFVETFYNAEDFPSDGTYGVRPAYDYYATSFAIPFYSLLYSKMNAGTDPDRAAKFRERARRNVEYLPYLFAPNGKAIPFGRSMTYRFAVSAFWSALAFDGQELPSPLTWGVIKGLIFRNIRGFTQRESVFRRDGTLDIGWFYPNMFMSEDYNSPQSPYWALKAFLFLALPKDHPFWAAEEEPYPKAWLEQPFKVVKSWSQVFSHAAGHTFCITAGQSIKFPMRGAAPKYSKLAYSASFGFSLPTANFYLTTCAPDSVLALSDDEEGERWVVPRSMTSVISDNGIIRAEWQPWPNVKVSTWVVPPSSNDCAYYVRLHRIESERPLKASDGGWATSSHHKGSPISRNKSGASDVEAGIFEEQRAALLVSTAGVSGVVDLLATSKGKAGVQHVDSGTNTNETRTGLPLVLHDVPVGEYWLATAVFGVPFDGEEGKVEWLERWKALSEPSSETLEELRNRLHIA